MSKRKAVRKVIISARQMIEVSLAQIIWEKSPQSRSRRPPGIPLGGGIILYDLSPIWGRIGDNDFRYSIQNRKLLIEVPEPEQLQSALEPHLVQSEQSHEKIRAILELGPGYYENTEFYSRFETLDAAQQKLVLSVLRQQYAAGRVNSLLWNWTRAKFSENRELLSQVSAEQQQSFGEMYQALRQSVVLAENLLNMVDWFIRSHQVPEGTQFLPPGLWTRGTSQEVPAAAAEDEQLELGEEEIPADDVRVNATRDTYYMGDLNCLSRIEPQGWFGNRRYVAYIYVAPSGERIAILDCAQIGNAAYIFRIGKPASGKPDAWLVDAGETKLELLTRPEFQRGTFERRFIHSANWQIRLKEWLEGTYPAAT